MPERKSTKRPREKYSRLICVGCHKRRIRCELPCEVETPRLGELREIQTSCYRCQRLDIPCVVRQTVLGRPGNEVVPRWNTAVQAQRATALGADSGVLVDLEVTPQTRALAELRGTHDQASRQNPAGAPRITAGTSDEPTSSQEDRARCQGGTLLIHKPQSSETVLVIRAIDTLRRERVEQEWFRHLPAYAGRSQTLEISVKALVAACAYARGVPKLTANDCYKALSLALDAVQKSFAHSRGQPNDELLASTALLVPFEGVVRMSGIVTRSHVEGLAAILAAQPEASYNVDLARDIVDFHVGETCILACVRGTPSPFEDVPRAFFAFNPEKYGDSDRRRLLAFANELFIRLPQLVMIVRALRVRRALQPDLLLQALNILQSLLKLQDHEAEARLFQTGESRPSSGQGIASAFPTSLHFASVKDYEALLYYWQIRLSLLRLQLRLCMAQTSMLNHVQGSFSKPQVPCIRPILGPMTDELSQLATKICMCSQYAAGLMLHKQNRLFAHALVVVWGAAKDSADICGGDEVGRHIGHSSHLLLRTINFRLSAEPAFTAVDMDTAAAMLVGGPITGRYINFYSF